jgi:hypothetical protein
MERCQTVLQPALVPSAGEIVPRQAVRALKAGSDKNPTHHVWQQMRLVLHAVRRDLLSPDVVQTAHFAELSIQICEIQRGGPAIPHFAVAKTSSGPAHAAC